MGINQNQSLTLNNKVEVWIFLESPAGAKLLHLQNKGMCQDVMGSFHTFPVPVFRISQPHGKSSLMQLFHTLPKV